LDGMNKESDTKRMSSSQPLVHLSPSNTSKQIKDKIARSFCQPGNLKSNVTIQWVRELVFRLDDNRPQFIERSQQNGGNLEVTTPDELEQLFMSEKLHPADLKAFLVQKLELFLQLIRASIDGQELSRLLKAASLNAN